MFLDRQDYPNAPGYSNPTTSKAAAASMEPHMGRLQKRIYDFLKDKPSTAREVEEILGMRTQTVTARIREMVLAELVKDSGVKRETDSGRKAIVWQVVS
jgi:hypothetical protein